MPLAVTSSRSIGSTTRRSANGLSLSVISPSS
jgi:hypothetical protein